MLKYPKIDAWGKRDTANVFMGAVVVQEKLDGANASFMLDEFGEFHCYSRNNQLTEDHNLQGFYQYCQQLNTATMIPGLTYFGEWLVKHKIAYGEEFLRKFYLYDIAKNGNFFSPNKYDASILGVELAPTISNFHLESSIVHPAEVIEEVGKQSLLDPSVKREGVVVKNYSTQQFVKFVSDEFRETMPKKKSKLHQNSDLDEWAISVTTKPRIEKLLTKLKVSGELPEQLCIQDMGTVLKTLGSSIVDDIISEELEGLQRIARKKISKIAPNIVREILAQGIMVVDV